jgi:ribose/xylose/arabinose/galactoside ABC-type transport system permease subunit
MASTLTKKSGRASAARAPEPQSGGADSQFHRTWADNAFQYTMAGLLVASVVVMSVVSPDFRNTDNLINILQQNSIIGVVACGMTLMIIAGGFDLSVGSVAAASGVLAATQSLQHGIAFALTAGLLLGLVVGVINGLLIAKAKINPFVATLGMSAVVQGLLFVRTDAKPVFGLPDVWVSIGLYRLGFMPSTVLVFIGVALLCWALLKYTLLGKLIYAVGSNLEGTRRSGVSVDRVVISAFAIGGLLAALGGLMLVTQSATGQPSAGGTWALLAIAAVVVGGTPLTGGGGGIGQTVVGTLLLGVMSNILNIASVSPYWQPAATGFLVLAAVGAERVRSRGRR